MARCGRERVTEPSPAPWSFSWEALVLCLLPNPPEDVAATREGEMLKAFFLIIQQLALPDSPLESEEGLGWSFWAEAA